MLRRVYVNFTDKLSLFEKNPKAPGIYVLVSCVFFVLVGVCVKKLPGIPPIQILFMRCLISMGINTMVIKSGRQDVYPQDNRVFKLLMMRCIFGGLGHIFYYTAISSLNLSDAQAIVLTSPIWTIILASILIKERPEAVVIRAMFISFLGILLVIKPPILLDALGFEGSHMQQTIEQSRTFVIGVTTAFLFSILESFSSILIKSLSSSVPTTAIVQYTYFSGFALNGLLIVASGQFNEKIYDMHNIMIIVMLAALNYIASMTSSRAFQIGKTTEIVPLTYSQLVLSFIVDITVLHKEINLLSLAGSALILFANFRILVKT